MRNLLDFMVKGLAACAAAFQFLTRLPVPVTLQYDHAMFRRSVVFYPLVGAVLGLLLSLGGLLLQSFLPPAAAAALMLLLWVAMTGALHLDGLMDTADGILSHRSREQMLEIMKDSRVGAMGVVACVLLLLIKWTLLQQWLPLSGRASGCCPWRRCGAAGLWSWPLRDGHMRDGGFRGRPRPWGFFPRAGLEAFIYPYGAGAAAVCAFDFRLGRISAVSSRAGAHRSFGRRRFTGWMVLKRLFSPQAGRLDRGHLRCVE